MDSHQRKQVTPGAEIDKVEMAREILETGKKMERQGLNGVLKEEVENPMVPQSAREHAERAFTIAADLDSDEQWRADELRRWAAAKRVKITKSENGALIARLQADPAKVVPIPEYLFMEPKNLERDLNYEVAKIGMHSVETVYNDVVAGKMDQRKPLNVLQLEEEATRNANSD